LDVTPISPTSLRQADARLVAGGYVVTGVDRPLDIAGRELQFFGRSARLPDVHVRLALRRAAPVVFFDQTLDETGVYHVDAEEVELARKRGHDGITEDCERVLAVAERMIAERPAQWAMPHAVWPDATVELDAAESGALAAAAASAPTDWSQPSAR
jgi:lauroyl/myristoyl acyltransferase